MRTTILLLMAILFSIKGFSQNSVVAFSAYFGNTNTTRTVNQTFQTNVATKVLFNLEEYDEMDNFKTGPNIIPTTLSEFTAPADGIYHFEASIYLNGPASFLGGFHVNGQIRRSFPFMKSGDIILADIKLAKGDIVDLRLNPTTAITIIPVQVPANSRSLTWFSGHKVN